MKTFYVSDDAGTLASCQASEKRTDRKAALQVMSALIEWTEKEGLAYYSRRALKAHVRELVPLKNDVDADSFKPAQIDGVVTSLGFTLSVFEDMNVDITRNGSTEYSSIDGHPLHDVCTETQCLESPNEDK